MRSLGRILLVLIASSNFLIAQTFDAKQAFQQKCSMCHGADGRHPTLIGKNLGAVNLGSEKVQQMKDETLRATIENGKGKMPAFGKSLGEKNIDAMVKYVRALKK